MNGFLDDTDDQSDTGSDLFATAIICIILLITILITQTGTSSGKSQFNHLEGNWILLFDISLEVKEMSSVSTRREPGTLTVGDREREAHGARPAGKIFDHFALDGRTGDLLEFDLKSSDFDPYFIIKGPDGVELDRDDDSGEGLGSFLSLDLKEDGVHEVIITSYHEGRSGTYDLEISHSSTRRAEPIWEASNSQVSNFSDQAAVHLWGGANRIVAINQEISSELSRVLGPLGEIELSRSPNLNGFADQVCLYLSYQTATLRNCNAKSD